MANTEAEEFLNGTISSDKNEILWSRFNINYNNELETFRKGSIVLRKYALEQPLERSDNRAKDAPITDEENEGEDDISISKTQKEKMKKARQKAKIIIEHIDIIKDEFWLRRPWLLSGKPGKAEPDEAD